MKAKSFEDAKEMAKCAVKSREEHIAINALSLTCGHHICKKCIPNNNNYQFKCNRCQKTNKVNLSEANESLEYKFFIRTHFNDFANHFKRLLDEEIYELECKLFQ